MMTEKDTDRVNRDNVLNNYIASNEFTRYILERRDIFYKRVYH